VKIKDLPKNWEDFAEEINPDNIPEDIAGKGNGVFDISCPQTETGILLIIKDDKAYRISEGQLHEAKTANL